MLICPVCRSQNMDTAKFCGNCGNSFPRPSELTSSLITCAQGHIYSAVYKFCPYCPQPADSDASAFITRVEEPITAIEPTGSASAIPTAPQNTFATRIDSGETLLETSEGPAIQSPSTIVAPSVLTPTEVISSIPGFETSADSALTIETTVETLQSPVDLLSTDKSAISSVLQEENQAAAANARGTESSASPAGISPDADRHTIVMGDEGSDRSTKGKIVGWLITYNRNPDGIDYRVYSGYNRLGANPICDIIIADETVSGSHAIIVYREGRCLIKDDLSRNGTFVNGREISEAHPLQNYDQIRIGNTYLTFVSAQRLT